MFPYWQNSFVSNHIIQCFVLFRSMGCFFTVHPYNRTKNKCFWLQISWEFCLLWLDSKFLGLFETNHLNVVYIQFVYNNFRKFLFTNAQVVDFAVEGHNWLLLCKWSTPGPCIKWFSLKPKAIIAGITENPATQFFIHFFIDNSNANISLYTLSQGRNKLRNWIDECDVIRFERSPRLSYRPKQRQISRARAASIPVPSL